MRSRNKKQNKKKLHKSGATDLAVASGPSFGGRASSVIQPESTQIEITAEESRILGFIRRDVVWAASILLVIVISLIVVDRQVSDSQAWSSLAEKIAKSAGLIK